MDEAIIKVVFLFFFWVQPVRNGLLGTSWTNLVAEGSASAGSEVYCCCKHSAKAVQFEVSARCLYSSYNFFLFFKKISFHFSKESSL